MATDDPFTFRPARGIGRRLMDVVAATGNEITRSGLINLALTSLFAQLEVTPGMIPYYDPAKDKSARQIKKRRGNRGNCVTGDEDV